MVEMASGGTAEFPQSVYGVASAALGNFPSQNARNRRYSIYSIKDGGEKRARGISELRGQESTPWTHKSFIYKQGLISQAG
ncbi:MAG: hypothetical protein M1541_13490, partial [Acidobacteria bacterium]|nr:hypothetical protein [Acidobacteriota bacterium]